MTNGILRFSILGDSVSALEGYIDCPCYPFYRLRDECQKANIFSKDDMWWGQVINACGGKLLVNNAWPGSTVCNHPKYEIDSYGASDGRTSALGSDGILPDVILVYIGTNDWGFPMKINPDPGEEEDICVFRPAYRAMLKKLRMNYPKADIWCFTPGVSTCLKNPEFSFPFRYAGVHINDYCKAIRDIAKETGCRLIDLYDPEHPYDTIDGFHPNADGMKTIATRVIGQIGDWIKKREE